MAQELEGQYLTITFDGTTRLGEAVNLCARFVPSNFAFVGNRLLSLTTTAKHMDGMGLYRLINTIILKDLNLDMGRAPVLRARTSHIFDIFRPSPACKRHIFETYLYLGNFFYIFLPTPIDCGPKAFMTFKEGKSRIKGRREAHPGARLDEQDRRHPHAHLAGRELQGVWGRFPQPGMSRRGAVKPVALPAGLLPFAERCLPRVSPGFTR